VRFVADLVAKGANGRDGTPLFDPQPLRLEGTLNVRNGQPIVDDSLSFDLLDDVPADVDLVTGATLQIIRHPVRGLGTVPSEVGVTLAQAGQIIGSTLPSQANVRFSRVGGPMSVEFLAQPDNQLSATLGPDPILVQATGRLSLLADFGLVSPVAGPFSLRLAGRADVDDNGQIIANNRLNFTLFPPGIPQPAGISGLQIVRHGLNPEPGTLALLSIGALALVRRRARSA
jgi:hypothetical protein